jgi:protein gp37
MVWCIAKLLGAKPDVAFLSVEPLLEDLGKLELRGIDWVIVSGDEFYTARDRRRV